MGGTDASMCRPAACRLRLPFERAAICCNVRSGAAAMPATSTMSRSGDVVMSNGSPGCGKCAPFGLKLQ